jgi:hypothetical protein
MAILMTATIAVTTVVTAAITPAFTFDFLDGQKGAKPQRILLRLEHWVTIRHRRMNEGQVLETWLKTQVLGATSGVLYKIRANRPFLSFFG